MAEEERLSVDTLEKGVHAHPRGSYIGGELTALRAATPNEPLSFHLSTKGRQGRFTIIVQCAKFPAILNGTSALEEAHVFLEKRFRQYIRIHADRGELEVIELVRIRGGPKRIDIRYGFGGTISAQDGVSVELKDESAASWFPSQNSSEAGSKQSSAEEPTTTALPAAENSPRAAFPVSPPTSEPSRSAAKHLPKGSGQNIEHHKDKEPSVSKSAADSTDRKRKRRKVEAPAAENGTVDDGVRSVASNPVTSPGTDQASARAAAPSVRHKVGDATQGKTYDSEEAFRASDLSHVACQPAIALAGETSGTVLDTQGIQISKLLVKPELLLSLNVHQREALRLAAEEKWLKRNPTFVPTSLNILEPSHVVPTRAPDKASTASLAAPKANEPREPEAHVVEIKDDRQRKKMLKATKQALAEPGGLAVPPTERSRGAEYLPLASLLLKSSSTSRPRGVIAVVCESTGPQAIGGRGDILRRLRLLDPTHKHSGPWLSLFTRNDEHRLPAEIPPGSVILIRGVKVFWDSVDVTIKCPAHADWTFCLLLQSPGPRQIFAEGAEKRSLRDPHLTVAEKEKMIRLQQWYNASFDTTADSERSAVSKSGQKSEKTWMTVVDREFCDLTVEIISMFNNPFPTKREFLVTDYTKNENFVYSNEHAPGIPEVGYLTLLTLWDGVACSADRDVIDVGDIVHFRNVAIKHSAVTRYGVEGNVRESRGAVGQQFRRFQVLDAQKDARARTLIERRDRLKEEMQSRCPIPPVQTCPGSPVLLHDHQLNLLDSDSAEIRTIHSQQPSSRIADIMRNPVTENVFRTKAWVIRIATRKMDPAGSESRSLSDLVVRRCKICDRYFEDKLCVFCKRLSSADLDYQYLFEVHLRDGKGPADPQLPVTISSKYMGNILPGLPVVTMTGKDEEQELLSACRRVEKMLQGAAVDGMKQCPLIDWSIARWQTVEGTGQGNGLYACGMGVPSAKV